MVVVVQLRDGLLQAFSTRSGLPITQVRVRDRVGVYGGRGRGEQLGTACRGPQAAATASRRTTIAQRPAARPHVPDPVKPQLKGTPRERSKMARSDGQTNLAEAGTLSMEFTTLGRITGAPRLRGRAR